MFEKLKKRVANNFSSISQESDFDIVVKAMLEALLSGINARVHVAIEMIESGRTYKGLGQLHKIAKVMPKPTDKQVELARSELSND